MGSENSRYFITVLTYRTAELMVTILKGFRNVEIEVAESDSESEEEEEITEIKMSDLPTPKNDPGPNILETIGDNAENSFLNIVQSKTEENPLSEMLFTKVEQTTKIAENDTKDLKKPLIQELDSDDEIL